VGVGDALAFEGGRKTLVDGHLAFMPHLLHSEHAGQALGHRFMLPKACVNIICHDGRPH